MGPGTNWPIVMPVTRRLRDVTQEANEARSLMSYGPSWSSIWRRSAGFVDKILHGTKPTGIPVERPMKLELIINLTVAKALGLTLPRMILARADELIE